MQVFNITAMIALWLGIYSADGQTAKDIKDQLFSPSMTDKEFSARPEKGDVYKSAYSTAGEVLQAFSIPFTSKGEITFKPVQFELGEFKIDVLMTPDRLRNSWLGFFVEHKEVDRSKWPIIRWSIEKKYIPKAAEDYEKEVAWYGWKRTGFDPAKTVNGTTFERLISSEDVAQPVNASMDGIWIWLLKNKDRINVINTGAIGTDAEAWCTKVESFCAQIHGPLRRKIDKLFMSEDNYNLYREGRRLKYNINYESERDLSAIKNCTIKVAWLESMEGSDKIWGTPKENRVKPTHVENTGNFDTQKKNRSVEISTDWKKGLGFEVPEHIVMNDLENEITAAIIAERYTEAA